MNKIDLIFEKEPPEVQRKLMNLLIQYNAMMQYNQSEDKFEVDLLLPFKTEREKQEFIDNYKSRSSRKEEYSGSKQNSFHIAEKSQSQSEQKSTFRKPPVDKQNKVVEIASFDEHEDNIGDRRQLDEQEISYDFTNDNESSMRRKTISLKDISSIIKNKIRGAVETIKQTNAPKSKQNSFQKDDEYQGGEYKMHANSIKLNKIQMEEGPDQDRNILGQFKNDQHGLKQRGNYSEHKEEAPQQQARTGTQRSKTSSGKSSQIKQEMLIQDLDEGDVEQQKDSRHSENHQKWNDNGGRKYSGRQNSHQPEDYQHRTHNSNKFPNEKSSQSKNHHHEQNINKQKERSKIKQKQKQKRQEQPNKINQKLTERYGSKKANIGMREKYSEFMKKNHRDFTRIYETIRKQIRRNQTQLMKYRKQDPILVLEQNLSEAYSEQDKVFKQEIIKDYQKHIIAENENMSSEDLVKYFRYLLQNAKSLYIKHIRKGK